MSSPHSGLVHAGRPASRLALHTAIAAASFALGAGCEPSTTPPTGGGVDSGAAPWTTGGGASPSTGSMAPAPTPGDPPGWGGPPGPTPDDGGEAGAADAGAPEDGGPDAAGPDAEVVDAGLADAAPADAGNTDAGHTDGDRPDAGCSLGAWDGTPPENLALSGNTFAHDPTMVEVDGVFYRFWTGDYIPSARSTDLKNWQNAPSVYPRSYPRWATDWLAGVRNQTFNFPWAPDVTRFGGQVHLYSSFSARFGDNVSCITHLTTDDIESGAWTDHGPVLCSDGSEPYNAIDADVGFDADGTPWMAYGSFWEGLFAIELDAEGNAAGGDPVRLAWAREIEAPVLFERCGWHYLFVTHGLCCPGEGRSVRDLTYRVLVGRSRELLGPYVDREGRPLLEGGGTLVVEGDGTSFAAAGHSDVIAVGDAAYHLYHAYRARTGAAELRISELYFDDDGWPVPHAP